MALSRIEFNVTGGIPPYDVSLTKNGFSDSQTISSDSVVTFSNLESGRYTITVTANEGECVATRRVNITETITTAPPTTAPPTTAAPTTAPPSTRPPLEPVDPCFGTDDVNNIVILAGIGGGFGGGLQESAAITINNNVAFDFDNETITSANVIVNVPNAPNVSGFNVQSTPFIGITVDFDGELVSGSYQFIFNTTTNCVATVNAIYNDQSGEWTVN